MIGNGLSIWKAAIRNQSLLLGGGGGPAALISAVSSDGWQATWASGTPPTFTPDSSPVTQAFTRQGFDATATATTISEDITMLRRVRNPYPSQATDTADSVALSDYIYSTDSCAGVTNSSAEISPVPIANWVMNDRLLTDNTVFWEIVAFHRNYRSGRQVAAVRVRANDGTNQTAWQVVSSTAVSTYCEDANPIETYSGTLTLTGITDGAMFWLEGEVMPWIGGAASVLKSEDSSVTREFSRRYFYKDTARAAAPPLAYVASAGASPAGNDATGVWSTNAATAAANPFLSVSGAMIAMTVGANATVTGSIADGCRIRIVDTVSIGASMTASRPQTCGSLIIERAPGTARSAAILTHAASFRPRLGQTGLASPLTEGSLIITDLTYNRTGAFNWDGVASTNAQQIRFHNVDLQNSHVSSSLAAYSHLYLFGVTMSTTRLSMGYAVNTQRRIVRGLTADMNSSGIEGWVLIGSTISRSNDISYQDTTKPFISYNNKWINPSSSGGVGAWIGTVSGGNIGAVAWVQNLIECYHTTSSTAGWRIANDSPVYGNVVHAVVYANTDTGYGSVSRANYLYDEAPVARFHKLMRHSGCIVSQLNTKGDVFQLDGTRLGQFAYSHGVGCQGNFTMFRTNSANFASEMQTYPGPGCSIGTSTTVRNDPLFTDYQATNNSGGAAATGGGDYTLTGPSPARGIVTVTGLRFDLAGDPRAATNDAAGCYA